MRGEDIEPQEEERGLQKGKDETEREREEGREAEALTEGESRLLAELQ